MQQAMADGAKHVEGGKVKKKLFSFQSTKAKTPAYALPSH